MCLSSLPFTTKENILGKKSHCHTDAHRRRALNQVYCDNQERHTFLRLLVKLKTNGMMKCFCIITVQGQDLMMIMLFLKLVLTHTVKTQRSLYLKWYYWPWKIMLVYCSMNYSYIDNASIPCIILCTENSAAIYAMILFWFNILINSQDKTVSVTVSKEIGN